MFNKKLVGVIAGVAAMAVVPMAGVACRPT